MKNIFLRKTQILDTPFLRTSPIERVDIHRPAGISEADNKAWEYLAQARDALSVPGFGIRRNAPSAPLALTITSRAYGFDLKFEDLKPSQDAPFIRPLKLIFESNPHNYLSGEAMFLLNDHGFKHQKMEQFYKAARYLGLSHDIDRKNITSSVHQIIDLKVGSKIKEPSL